MAEIYTVGIWTVKAGREAEFVAAWRAMGEATLIGFPGAHGTLLHDADKPARFISFGPWASLDEGCRHGAHRRRSARGSPRSASFSTASKPARTS
jgi:heme-degrading monooxygenase HmoA